MQQARGGALPAAPPRVRVAKLLRKRSRADLPLAPFAAVRESAIPDCFSAPNPAVMTTSGVSLPFASPSSGCARGARLANLTPTPALPSLNGESLEHHEHLPHLPPPQYPAVKSMRTPEISRALGSVSVPVPLTSPQPAELACARSAPPPIPSPQRLPALCRGWRVSLCLFPTVSISLYHAVSLFPSQFSFKVLPLSLRLSMPDSPATPGEPSFFTCPRSY